MFRKGNIGDSDSFCLAKFYECGIVGEGRIFGAVFGLQAAEVQTREGFAATG